MGRAKGSVKPGEVIDVPVRLIGRGQITIKVRGSDTTTPIPGARVELKQLDFPNQSLDARDDSQGVLVVDGGDAFTEGAYVVIATDLDNGFAGRASGVVTHDGQEVTTTVFLYNQRGVVYGSVSSSPTGSPPCRMPRSSYRTRPVRWR